MNRGRHGLRILRFAAFGIAAVALFGWVVMSLWNWLIPGLTGWHTLGFPQALGLLVLCRILFGRFGHLLAEIARRMLAEEWNLAERVFIETDLADFQARLLDAVAGMQSLATIELAALSEYRPEWAAAFRSVIEEIVDADTLGSMRAISSEGWANIGRATDRIANTPLLSSLAGVLDGRPAVVVTDLNPAAETIDALRRAHAHATLVATPAAAVALHAHGLNCDLVIADEPAPPPVGIVGVLASTTLAITPESHPSWWELPAAARMVFGHSAVSWMFADGDPTAVFSLSFGPTLPLSLACLSLGARPIAVVSPPPGLDSRWNLMSARTRTERVLSRCAALAGSEFVSVESIANQPVLAQPTGAIADLARTRGRSLGHAELQRGLARARRAIGRLAREQRQFARTPLRDLLAMYLRFRAEGSAFTKSFLVASSKPLTSPESQASLREAAFGWIDWVEEQLPPAPPPPRAAAPPAPYDPRPAGGVRGNRRIWRRRLRRRASRRSPCDRGRERFRRRPHLAPADRLRRKRAPVWVGDAAGAGAAWDQSGREHGAWRHRYRRGA